MIRNYLGFHRGISGGELAHRAWQQATLLGAEFIFTNRATALTAESEHHVLTLDDGSRVAGRAASTATSRSRSTYMRYPGRSPASCPANSTAYAITVLAVNDQPGLRRLGPRWPFT